METIKVLLFAASPRGAAPLDLPREFREIDEEVRMSPHRAAVELILVPGTRPVDLLRKLNENRPQVVHFSSHGEPGELILESGEEEAGQGGALLRSADERNMERLRPEPAASGETGSGQPHRVSRSALVDVLRSTDEGNLRLVVLNACHTRTQAEALTEVVDCVVSMNRAVSDRAAIKFAASFYGALAFGRSVRTALEQGLARLSAEGIGETDTPELLVRAGVDASRVVLVRPAPDRIPVPVAPPAAEVPFIVPFPRNADFVGREGDLSRLHATLSGARAGPVGIRPAGLTGMGGIGKTQLAVEYVHRHKEDYADGIFWIDAAVPLAEGFARLATDPRLRWAEADRPRDEQIRAAFMALNDRPHALLVLDNLPDPAAIAMPLLPGCTPEDLCCRLLFTTRRHDLGRFAGVEVTVLPEEPALRLLLRHPTRRAALDPAHPDHEHARAIARMLGRLPLALELAGAYLGKYSGSVPLAGYREGLKSDGALATLDADAAELSEADLRRMHDPAVAATIGEQWGALRDDSARLLLRVASLFPESSAVPIVRLGLLAGLGDEAKPGRPSPLRRALQRLDDGCLVERLEAEQIRLHPLIREFAVAQTPSDQTEGFRSECLTRAADALEHLPTLEGLDAQRGVDGLQEDLIAILELCPPSALDLGARLQRLLRLLQREAHHLRDAVQESRPTFFAQQIRNRASLLGIHALQSTAEQRLAGLGRAHFRLLWTASRESRELIRTLSGHEDWVCALAVSSDSRHAFSGSGDNTLRSWDLRTGELLRTFTGHEDKVSAVAVSSDGRRALSGSHDCTLRLWDLTAGQSIHTLSGHEDMVFAVAMSPDAHLALSGSRDRTLRLWDLRTGELISILSGHEDGVGAVAVAPDFRHALSGSRDRTLKLWDLQAGRLLRTIAGHEGMVFAVAMTPDGRQALSGSDDRTLRLWDLRTSQLLRTFEGHQDGVNAVAVGPDGRRALSGSDDRTLRLWDLQTGQLLGTLAGHEHGIYAVAITSDGRHGLSGSDDRTIKLWDLGASPSPLITRGHEGQVTVVAVSADGRQILSGSYDRTLRLWDSSTGQLLHYFAGHESAVIAAAISPDGLLALSGSYDRMLRLWDLRSGELRASVTMSNPEARHLPSWSLDEMLRLWNPVVRQEVQTILRVLRVSALRMLQQWVIQLFYSPWINAVATSSNGRCAFAGLQDRTLKLWDLYTGETIRSFLGHEDTIHAVALASDDRRALSGSADRTLRLWDVSTGQLLHSFTGHAGPVIAVSICPDGRFAVSGSRDRTLRLWDLEERTCQAVAPLESAPQAITAAPDGRAIVVGDRVGNIHYFRMRVN
jgi:WD40 repeat protein